MKNSISSTDLINNKFFTFLRESKDEDILNMSEVKQIISTMTTISTILNGLGSSTFSQPKADVRGSDIFCYVHDIKTTAGIIHNLSTLNGVQVIINNITSDIKYNIQASVFNVKLNKVGLTREAKFTSLEDTLEYLNEIIDEINRWSV